MSIPKTGIAIAVVLLVAGAAYGIALTKPTQNVFEKTETYVNLVYGYQLHFPHGADLGYNGLASTTPIDRSAELIIGEPTVFQVNALLASSSEVEGKGLKPVYEIAQSVREYQVSHPSEFSPGRRIGDLEEIEFAGRLAPSFTLTDAYESADTGYLLLPSGTPYRFVFVENADGVPLMIQYPTTSKAAQSIARSFTLVASD